MKINQSNSERLMERIVIWETKGFAVQNKCFSDAKVSSLLKAIDRPHSQDVLDMHVIRVLARLAQNAEYANKFSSESVVDRITQTLGNTDNLTGWETRSIFELVPDLRMDPSFPQTLSSGFQHDAHFAVESLTFINNILEFGFHPLSSLLFSFRSSLLHNLLDLLFSNPKTTKQRQFPSIFP